MSTFIYPIEITPDEGGGFVAVFPDFPEAITQGETLQGCLAEAADCLEEAVAGRMDDGEEIPNPSPVGRHAVNLPIRTALKASLHMALREKGISCGVLAEKLRIRKNRLRQILDPRHETRVETLEGALLSLGKTVTVSVFPGRQSA